MKIKKFNEEQGYILKEYQGTIVKVLPSDRYFKKYWNKKHYVERQKNNTNGTPQYYLQESIDGKNGWYGSVFCTNAIEHEHFEFIKGSTIHNSFGEEIGIVE